MEVVKVAVAIVLVLCSITPISNTATAPPNGDGGGVGDPHSMPCIKKLMTCQPYLHSVTLPPPPSCCMPLKEIVKNDVMCLCSVFNNVDLLKSFNLTKENALDLPKACGAKADVSQCKASAGTTPPSSPATPKTPPASSTGSDSTGAPTSSTVKTTNSAPAIRLVGLSFASAFFGKTLLLIMLY